MKDILWWLLRQSRWFFVLVLGFVSWADLSGADISTLSSAFHSIMEGWFWLALIVTASVWVGIDLGGRHSMRKNMVQKLDESSNYALIALKELRKKIRLRPNDPNYAEDFNAVFEPLLQSACSEYCAFVGMPSSTIIKANLLLLTGENEITVVARSRPGSPVPAPYEIDERYPAAIAISENKTCVISDAHKIDPNTNRPYRSVAASPLEAGGMVYGAITLDSPTVGLFYKKEEDIDRILRVYASIALLALNNNLIPRDCPNRYGR